MKKILKWAGIVLGTLLVAAFLAFLYFIPPFTLLPPEEFIKPVGLGNQNRRNLRPRATGSRGARQVPRDGS